MQIAKDIDHQHRSDRDEYRLTNSAAPVIESQVKHAGIEQYFEKMK